MPENTATFPAGKVTLDDPAAPLQDSVTVALSDSAPSSNPKLSCRDPDWVTKRYVELLLIETCASGRASRVIALVEAMKCAGPATEN